MPDGNYENDHAHEHPDSSNHRTISESPSHASMTITGPEEYLTSELSVKLLTSARPVFTAKLSDIDGVITSDNFNARIDRDQISCTYNFGDGSVSFQPNVDLADGMHQAQLILVNPGSSQRMLHWSFMVRTALPTINMVMWNQESKWALVVFNESIEPSVMKDQSRWSFNRESNILRGPIGSAGDNMALLPLTNQAIGRYQQREALTIGFNEKNGIVDYVVSRGGGVERDVQTDCNCSRISFTWIPGAEHKFLEAAEEHYAFAYTFDNPNYCPVEMEWSAWTRTPVGHDSYENEFATNEDHLCEGIPETGTSQDPYPDEFNMLIDNEGPQTVAFDRKYRHNLTVSVWADCTDGDRPGTLPADPHETFVTTKTFILGPASSSIPEGFDCTNPVFDQIPLVLYGDEAAQKITDLMSGVSFYDDGPSGTWYCGWTQAQFESAMNDLRADTCGLYIVAKASDPIYGNRYGNMDIQHMVLDYKHEPEGGSPLYEYTDIIEEMVMGISLDHYPWAEEPYTSSDREIVLNWPDPNYPTGGMFYCDGSGAESSIQIFPLTDILLDEDYLDVTDIRVRIVDNNPMRGIEGNWIRSDNVMNQLFVFDQREGERVASENRSCAVTGKLKIKIIADNPYDDDTSENAPTNDPYAYLKEALFSGATTDDQTAFIFGRNTQGCAVLPIYVYVSKDYKLDPRDPNATKIWLEVNSHEFKNILGYSEKTTVEVQLFDPNNDLRDRLCTLFGLSPPDCSNCRFFKGDLTVSDDITSRLNVLYVSSSDHETHNMDTGAKRMDHAISIGWGQEIDPSSPPDMIWRQVTSEESAKRFKFGHYRGLGDDTPSSGDDKKWYSYDEFITNGGFEVVEVYDVVGNYPIEGAKPKVAVQSEADVMLLFAHGGDASGAPVSSASRFSYPSYTDQIDDYDFWADNAGFHFAKFVGGECLPDNTLCNDYGGSGGWNNFWQAKTRSQGYPELRWLAIVGCNALAKGDPAENWKLVIEDINNNDKSYLSSVCGFSNIITKGAGSLPMSGDFVTNGKFTQKYGKNMESLMANCNFNYEPSGPVFLTSDFWRCTPSCDISVSAYMEAACEFAGSFQRGLDNQYYLNGLGLAVALDKDNHDGVFYYYSLINADVYTVKATGKKFSLKINRD